MRPIISIIVPVYNVEAYLRQCLDSILSQTFTAWELILVDDGSPDGSGAICDEYAAKDSRVRVFHIPNGGVSNARNVGMEAAKGDWITFIDSDDWVGEDFLDSLYAPINKNPNIEFVHGEMQNFIEGVGLSYYRCIKPYMGNDKAYLLKSFDGHIASKLYKKEIITNHRLKFDINIILSEDYIFNTDYIKHINYYCFNQTTGYFYRQRADSATKKKTSIRPNSFLTYLRRNIEFLTSYIETHNIKEEDSNVRWNNLSNKVFYTIYSNGIRNFDRVTAQHIYHYIKKYRLCHYQKKWRRWCYLQAFCLYTLVK